MLIQLGSILIAIALALRSAWALADTQCGSSVASGTNPPASCLVLRSESLPYGRLAGTVTRMSTLVRHPWAACTRFAR